MSELDSLVQHISQYLYTTQCFCVDLNIPEFALSDNYRSLTGKKLGGPKILNVSGQNDQWK